MTYQYISIRKLNLRVMSMKRRYLQLRTGLLHTMCALCLLCLLYLLISLLLVQVGSASESYVKADIYFNDQLCSGKVPKPLVLIGEPFTIRANITADQYCKVYARLLDPGVRQGIESFTVIKGPSNMSVSAEHIFQKGETYCFEWTLEATKRWAGGTMPITLYYSVVLPGGTSIVAHDELTVAVVSISDEQYVPPPLQVATARGYNDTTSPTLPSFTLHQISFAVCVVYVLKGRKFMGP